MVQEEPRSVVSGCGDGKAEKSAGFQIAALPSNKPMNDSWRSSQATRPQEAQSLETLNL